MDPSIHQTFCRVLVGTGCLGFSYWAATTGYKNLELVLMASSIPVFTLGVIILWKPLFTLLTRPLIAMVDSLFFPGGKLEKPTLNFKLPSYFINEGRYTEALEEYERIMKHYPDEVEAYEKSIWLCQDKLNDPEKARRILRKAAKRHLAIDDRFRQLINSKPELSELEESSR